MGLQKQARIVFAAALLAAGIAAHGADCTDDYQETSNQGAFPNRPAGAVAWNGSVVGVARRNDNVPLVFTRFDQNLKQLGDTTATSSVVSHDLKLLSGGGEFAVVFFAPSGALMFQEINGSGVRVGPEIQVGPSHPIYANQQFDAAYNPQLARWEIVYSIPFSADAGLWVTSIPLQSGPAGAVLDRRIEFFIADPPVPRIAVASNGVIGVSWYRIIANQPTLYLSIFDSQYSELRTNLLTTNAQMPMLTGGASAIALLYQAASGGNTELRWVRADTSGISGADARIVAGSGIDVVPVGMIWNATLNEWAIAYLDVPLGVSVFPGDYRLRRLTSGGALISDALFTPDLFRSNVGGRYAPAWAGSADIGSIERASTDQSGSLSYVVKHCPLTAAMTVYAPTPLPFQQFTFTGNVGGGMMPYTYAWDFGDRSSAQGQVASHSYLLTGTYTVTLTVTDALGDKSVNSTNVVVTDKVRRRSVKK